MFEPLSPAIQITLGLVFAVIAIGMVTLMWTTLSNEIEQRQSFVKKVRQSIIQSRRKAAASGPPGQCPDVESPRYSTKHEMVAPAFTVNKTFRRPFENSLGDRPSKRVRVKK